VSRGFLITGMILVFMGALFIDSIGHPFLALLTSIGGSGIVSVFYFFTTRY
jgi:hypothetical protein